jgi:hypothetical protein
MGILDLPTSKNGNKENKRTNPKHDKQKLLTLDWVQVQNAHH